MDRHHIFLRDWVSNERTISARVPGNWSVRCGHCGVTLAGCRGGDGPVTEIEWRHDRDSWFGAFIVLAHNQARPELI